jgi:uncharacterized membrane protein
MRGHQDLRRAMAASVLCAAVALILPFPAVCLVFAIPLCLFLPGYAIATAAFAHRPLARMQTLVFSVGLSLAVLALGTLLLNYLPGGLQAGTWALLLVLVVFGGCRAAALRRPKPSRASRSTWPRLQVSKSGGVLLGGGILTTIAALVLAMTPVPAKNAVGYTELWLSTRSNARSGTVRVVVRSEEQHEVGYFLRVRLDGEKPKLRLFNLVPGETRMFQIHTAPPSGAPLPVVASLFRQDEPKAVYRRLTGWIPLSGKSR